MREEVICRERFSHAALSQRVGTAAVSYTHLDVDKRQTLDTVTRNEIQQGTHVIYAPGKDTDGKKVENLHRYGLDKTCVMTAELVARAATAVSYTHLDVYKRQVQGRPNSSHMTLPPKRWQAKRCRI